MLKCRSLLPRLAASPCEAMPRNAPQGGAAKHVFQGIDNESHLKIHALGFSQDLQDEQD